MTGTPNLLERLLLEKEFFCLQVIEGELVLFYGLKKAYRFYPDHHKDILEDKVLEGGEKCLENFLSSISVGESISNHLVFHAFYEWGHLLNGSRELEKDTPLGLWLEFKEKSVIHLREEKVSFPAISWTSIPYTQYEKAFMRGKEHLKRGDCYQYNLTYPFNGSFQCEKDGVDLNSFLLGLLSHPEKRGAFAGVTFLKDEVYFSNSPESLFTSQVLDNERTLLETRPIKGTATYSEGYEEEAAKVLMSSEKDKAELFMITDLLRNDLNRIENPKAVVLEKQALLKVPGLMHTYSKIQIDVSKKTPLFKIFKSLFPGGSITGAPKKRVMEILDDIELGPRGFYCGTTLIKSEGTCQGSINIRSGKLSLSPSDKKEGSLSYHAGGGITFMSHPHDEYQEMLAKLRSFSQLFDS